VLYTVSEISDLIGLSKVSIYNKLKLKELQEHISKNQGITYVDEVGFNLIKEGLKLKEDDLNVLNEEDQKEGSKADDERLLTINIELIKTLNDQLKEKDIQISKKDIQISELHKLIENTQILLKQQQDKELKQLQLEEHFKEIDNRLVDLRSKMEDKKDKKNNIFSFLKK
jgi:hypothetical protein